MLNNTLQLDSVHKFPVIIAFTVFLIVFAYPLMAYLGNAVTSTCSNSYLSKEICEECVPPIRSATDD